MGYDLAGWQHEERLIDHAGAHLIQEQLFQRIKFLYPEAQLRHIGKRAGERDRVLPGKLFDARDIATHAEIEISRADPALSASNIVSCRTNTPSGKKKKIKKKKKKKKQKRLKRYFFLKYKKKKKKKKRKILVFLILLFGSVFFCGFFALIGRASRRLL
jgi:hypothetical protein